jgi:hypothetical protein
MATFKTVKQMGDRHIEMDLMEFGCEDETKWKWFRIVSIGRILY